MSAYTDALEAQNPIRCAPRGVYGLAQLIEIRRSRCKPERVSIRLVRRIDRCFAPLVNPHASTELEIQVSPEADLTALDLRPLVGLEVHLRDDTLDDSLAPSFRRLADKAWAIETEFLAVHAMTTKSGNFLFVRDKSGTHRLPL